MFKRVISYTIFVKSKIIKNIHFDQMLGVSKIYFSIWRRGRFCIKHFKENYKYILLNKLFIYHPHQLKTNDLILRTKKYVPGKSYVLKNIDIQSLYFCFYILSFIKAFWSILRFSKNETFLNYISFKYRLKGYLKSKVDNL